MVMSSPVWKDLSKHEGISFSTDDNNLGDDGTKYFRNASLHFYRYFNLLDITLFLSTILTQNTILRNELF